MDWILWKESDAGGIAGEGHLRGGQVYNQGGNAADRAAVHSFHQSAGFSQGADDSSVSSA